MVPRYFPCAHKYATDCFNEKIPVDCFCDRTLFRRYCDKNKKN